LKVLLCREKGTETARSIEETRKGTEEVPSLTEMVVESHELEDPW
jgi:hypothetical protein